MKKTIFLIIVVIALYPFVLTSCEFETNVLRRDNFQRGTELFFKPKEGKIIIVGELTRSALEAIQVAVKAPSNYTEIVVDSQGGDAESALEIAEIIHRLNLRLIVDGRCFSACANFLFPAAKRKIVLQSSIVGIHEESVNFLNNGLLTYITGNEIETGLMQSGNVDTLEKFRVIQEKMRAFNLRFRLNDDLHKIFRAYVTRRKHVLEREKIDAFSGTATCPKILMWVLSREQLESIGVKGIEGFWYPEKKHEKEALIPKFGSIGSSLYFGTPDRLNMYCNTGLKNWMNLQWQSLINK